MKDQSGHDPYPERIDQLEVRSLRYFIAVAEELNFSRAAERLGIAGPPLSRAIARLETQLGVRLLERTTRRVQLTPAGSVLLAEGRIALQAFGAAARRSQQAARAETKLVLALKADIDGGLLEPAIEAYALEPASVPVEVVLCGWQEQVGLLADGRADLAFVLGTPAAPGIEAQLLLTEPTVVALAPSHPLAARSRLTLADIEASHCPTTDPYIWQTPAARQADPDPNLPDDLSYLLRLIELQTLVMALPASVAARYRRPQIVYRRLQNEEAEVCLAWSSHRRAPRVDAFLRAAADVAKRSSAVDLLEL